MSRTTKAVLVAAAHAVALYCPCAFAGINFDEIASKLSITHDPDRSTSTIAERIKNVSPVPSSAGMPDPSSYQLIKTFASGAASSTSNASLGHITSNATTSFTLAAGTGVTQTDPGNDIWPGASSLKLGVDLLWDVTGAGFGNPAEAFVSIAVGAHVGQGGGAQYLADLSFTDPTTGTTLAPRYTDNFGWNSPGDFVKTFTYSAPFNLSTVPAGRKIRVKGFVELRASNEHGPSNIIPINAELGAAPPTFTWINPGSGDWNNAGNWDKKAVPGADDIDRGRRVRFLNTNTDFATINLPNNFFVGEMVIDSRHPYNFVSSDKGGIIFDRPAPVGAGGNDFRAVLHVRDVYGKAAHNIAADLNLFNALEIISDVTPTGATAGGIGGINLQGAVGGSGGIFKMGNGSVAINNPSNQYRGGTVVLDGVLMANATGSLSLGPVDVNGGQLDYNAPHAANRNVTVRGGGTLNLGIVPDANEFFTVQADGSVRGSSEELAALDASVKGNLAIAPGASIIQERVDSALPRNLPAGQFIYGVGNDIAFRDDFHFGSGSRSPWIGIGVDKSVRITAGSGALVLDGLTGQLVAPEDGALVINNALARAPSIIPPTLTKRGRGAVVLNASNKYNGTIDVTEGSLFINGSTPATIRVSAGALAGGTGSIAGTLNLGPSVKETRSVLAPGSPITNTPVGTLALQTLSLQDGLLQFEFFPDVHDKIVLTGSSLPGPSLNLSGTSLIDIIDEGLAAGTYTLIDYTTKGGSGGFALSSSTTGEFDLELVDNSAATALQLIVRPALPPQWNRDGSGSWEVAGNWIGDVPDGVGQLASFLGQLKTPANAPAVVVLNKPHTLGYLEFNNNVALRNAASYTLTGEATRTLTMDNGVLPAIITVHSGRQIINVPLIFQSEGHLNTAADALLTVTASTLVQDERRLDKNGAGRANLATVTLGQSSGIRALQGTLDTGAVSGPISSAAYAGPGANLLMTNIRAGGLVADGSVVMKSSGDGDVHSNVGTSKVEALVIGNAGEVNIQNNGLIVGRGNLSSIRGLVIAGRGSTGGVASADWDGTRGITSSAASKRFQLDGNKETRSIGYALNGDLLMPYRSFMGQVVDADDVLIRYTRNGDANLDGVVNNNDITILAGFYRPGTRGRHWYQADFNYDGEVDITDITILAGFYNPAATALADAGTSGIVAVPEPGLGVFGGALMMLISRRRRR